MNEDVRVNGVVAVSWIVAEKRSLLRRLGFEVEDGLIDEEMRKRHFSDETRPIARAYITRDELLRRYLPKN